MLSAAAAAEELSAAGAAALCRNQAEILHEKTNQKSCLFPIPDWLKSEFSQVGGVVVGDWPYLSLDQAGRAGASHALHGLRRRHAPVGSSQGAVGPPGVPGVLNHGVDVLQGAAGMCRERKKEQTVMTEPG